MANKIVRTKSMPALDFKNVERNKKELQEFYQKQIYSKGFFFQTSAGSTVSPKISLGGSARRLHGISVFNDLGFSGDQDTFSLTINEEVIIEDVIWWAYNPQGISGNIFKETQYFPIPRPLSGSDSVELDWNASNSHNSFIVFYLSNFNE